MAAGPGSAIGWPPEASGGVSDTAQICLDYLIHEDISGELRPNLATSWEVDSNAQNPSVTFKLRQGVKFHDGSPFNAQVVKWAFDNAKKGVNVSTTRWWKSIDVVDDYTVRVNMTAWKNNLLRSFGALTCMINSQAAYEKNGLEWVKWNMVGTHAFKQVEFVKDVQTTTVRNEEYWDAGKPYLQGIQLLYVADELTRTALFKTGGGEVMGVSSRIASELQAEGYKILTGLGGAQMLIPDSMNPESPWANPKVREAAEYAIDKEAICKAFGYGFLKPAYQIAPSNTSAYIPSLEGTRKYDPAKAKKLLSEAGYPSGFKTKIITQSGGSQDVPTAYQSYLKAVGIEVDLDFPDAAKMSTISTGTWTNALVSGGLINYPNFNAVLSTWLSAPNSTFYKSMKKPEGYEAMFNASMNSTLADPALMQKCVQAFYDDCTVINVYYATTLWASQNYVYDTGHGTRGSSTQWNQQNAFISK